ncbi:MAG: hypothetical protein HYY16_01255 [Planctomycetes bacterium]|nr:hypothetical protein [Planctomycetota bacterium]
MRAIRPSGKHAAPTAFSAVKILAAGLAVSITLAILAAPLHAQDRLGAAGADKLRKMCLKCHEKFEQSLAGKTPHKPLEEGKCIPCHNPHASDDKHFLDDAEARLCVTCHKPFEQVLARPFVHTPLKKRGCSDCHDPHAATTEDLLKETPAKLCATCHNQKEKFEQAVVHAPVKEGKCMECHDPHASKEPAVVRKGTLELCLSCHQDSAKLTTSHSGLPIQKLNCLVCHDPHSSANKKLLKTVTHYPVQQADCAGCHTAEPGDVQALKKAIPELCYDCHAKREKFARAVVHKPVSEGKCLDCHDAHATSSQKLLKHPPKQLCFSCHPQIAAIEQRSAVHAPFQSGECVKCHDPHASDHASLTHKRRDLELCESCHKRHQHAVDVQPSDKIEVISGSRARLNTEGKITCLSCHDAHGTDIEKMLHYGKDRDLCIQCHKLK